jgi:hypothetical protein
MVMSKLEKEFYVNSCEMANFINVLEQKQFTHFNASSGNVIDENYFILSFMMTTPLGQFKVGDKIKMTIEKI